MNNEIKELWFKEGHLNEDQRDFLIDKIKKINPKYCLETGFASGRSCVTVYFTANPEKMVSIDADLDYFEGARDHSKKILKKAKNLNIIEEDSTKLDFKDIKKNYLNNNNLDFAFIDGSHSYEGCLKDLNNTLSISRSGTLIIVDDYESGPPEGCPIVDVTRAVDDFVKNNNLNMEKWNCKGKGFAIILI